MRPWPFPASRTSRDRRRWARRGDWLLPGSTSPRTGAARLGRGSRVSTQRPRVGGLSEEDDRSLTFVSLLVCVCVCPCVSLSCVETVLWFWNAPPLPRGLRLWGRRQGLSSASSTEKEAAERLEAGEFPVRSWGREGLYTLSSKLEPHGARSGVSSQDFLRLEGVRLEQRLVLFFSLPTFLWHRRSASTL